MSMSGWGLCLSVDICFEKRLYIDMCLSGLFVEKGAEVVSVHSCVYVAGDSACKALSLSLGAVSPISMPGPPCLPHLSHCQ